jgi:hypothetical protein
MLPSDLSQLTREDLQRLVDNEVVESKTIDYKRDRGRDRLQVAPRANAERQK